MGMSFRFTFVPDCLDELGDIFPNEQICRHRCGYKMGTALYCFIFYPHNVVRLALDHNNNNSNIISKSFKKCLSNLPGERDINIQRIHYKRQLYLDHHTQYGQYCSVKLEA